MKEQENIEQKVNQTLNSLDGLQQADINDYLYNNIMERIQQADKVVSMQYNKVMLRLAAVLALFIGINCVSYYALHKTIAGNTIVKTNPADAFASAYGLNSNTDSY